MIVVKIVNCFQMHQVVLAVINTHNTCLHFYMYIPLTDQGQILILFLGATEKKERLQKTIINALINVHFTLISKSTKKHPYSDKLETNKLAGGRLFTSFFCLTICNRFRWNQIRREIFCGLIYVTAVITAL